MSFWLTLADLLLPRHCVVCGEELSSTEHDICNVCLCKLSPVSWSSATDNPFLRSLWDKYDVEAAGSSLCYNSESHFHNIFISIKYRGNPQLGERLAGLMFPYWQERGLTQGVDYIIPVPLARRRKWQRGYNQSEWIARGVSLVTGIPLCTDVLRRRKYNKTQTRMTASQRWDNVNNIFDVTGKMDLNGKTILLVDDIVTTGATLSDCMRALYHVFPMLHIRVYSLGWSGEG